MSDEISPPSETPPPEASSTEPGVVQPVPTQPPEQEHQTQDPGQLHQVSQAPAAADEPPEITLATSIGDLVKETYFIADNLGEPVISQVAHNHVSLLYPSDDSMIHIRLESRAGRWAGIGPKHATDQLHEQANKAFDAQQKGFEDRQAAAKEAAGQEAHDDAHAREEAKQL